MGVSAVDRETLVDVIRRVSAAALTLLLAAGCYAGDPNVAPTPSPSPPAASASSETAQPDSSSPAILPAPTPSLSPSPSPTSNGLARRDLTPGETDPTITQATIHQTICVSGYTATVRPPTSLTNRLKIAGIAQYGYADPNPAGYVEDHLVALELAGAARSPRNLWPQPRGGTKNASLKDAEENTLHAAVCAGTMTLANAQARIISDWTQ